MPARERVMIAVAHQEPDRVPIDLWVAPEVKQRLSTYFACDYSLLLDLLGVDFRVVQGPRYVGPELKTCADGSVTDVWGVVRRPVTYGQGERMGTYLEVAHSPLAHASSVREVEEYGGWPSPDWWDYSHIADECRRHAGKCVVYAGDRLDRTAQLKPAMYLRGVEQIMVDLAGNPAIAQCIIERIAAYFLEYNRRVFQAAAEAIDIFMMGDDFGMQTALLMSLNMWERFLAPGFRAYVELAHKYGVKVMHHTCGAVEPLIPRFIDAGLDILQSLQPRAAGMDLATLKKKYGRHLCFQGSMDIQQTMPYGTPQDVRHEVQERMNAGKPGGGFIICTAHNIQPDAPLENIVALLDAYHAFAPY
jgi:uroporphyrinogen decarboxylase